MERAGPQMLFQILQEPIEISSLKLYASMQILRRVMETSAWKYPHAAFKSDLSLKNKIDKLGKFFRPNFISSASYRENFSEIYHFPITLFCKR